jgi:hypothetical protein
VSDNQYVVSPEIGDMVIKEDTYLIRRKTGFGFEPPKVDIGIVLEIISDRVMIEWITPQNHPSITAISVPISVFQNPFSEWRIKGKSDETLLGGTRL